MWSVDLNDHHGWSPLINLTDAHFLKSEFDSWAALSEGRQPPTYADWPDLTYRWPEAPAASSPGHRLSISGWQCRGVRQEAETRARGMRASRHAGIEARASDSSADKPLRHAPILSEITAELTGLKYIPNFSSSCVLEVLNSNRTLNIDHPFCKNRLNLNVFHQRPIPHTHYLSSITISYQ